MQEWVILTNELDRQFQITLSRGIGQELVAIADIKKPLAESFLLRLASLSSLSTHEATRQMGEIGHAFASLLGASFMAAIRQCLISPPVTFRILCECSVSHRLPWELLPCPLPLGLTQNVRIVRLASGKSIPNPTPKNEMALGLMAAEGQSLGYDALQAVESEVLAIANLFHRSKSVRPTCIRPAARDKVRPAPDLFHFLGHGDIRPSGGLLQFADGYLYGDDLARALLTGPTRLCFLSACSTAGDERAVGCVLARAGIPAVVAMQCPISDEGARHFARAFYLSVSLGNPVEDAIRDARFSIQGMGRDWFAPVLLRSGWSDPLTVVRKEEHNFPAMATQFVGRQEELASILKLVHGSGRRIVTLTGMGGIGKTTLGCQVGRESAAAMPDGAYLVECEAARTRGDLVAAVAAALGIRGSGNLEADVEGYLRNRKILLVFDCFERIVSLSGYLLNLVQTCPEIKILATSRILLGLPGEAEFRVPPMSAKRKKRAHSEAVELFVTTAAQYLPGFEQTSKNRAQIQQVVEDLECVPLALLLAASRLRHFSLDELAERIRANRLETLQRRSPGDDKHADLYRVIGDSLDLLEESDRVLLGILSVFAGGFYLTDAEAVVGEFGSANSIGWLRDNSLLNAHIEGGQMRYRMLDTIREYLQASPYTQDLGVFERRHAETFAKRAQELTSLTGTSKWTSIARAYPIDAANYRQAVEFAMVGADRELLRTFILTLARVWTELGRPDELNLVRPSIDSLFADDVELTVEMCGLEGELAKRNGDYAASRQFWRRRAEVCRAGGDHEAYADSLLDMAELGFMANEPSLTEDVLREFDGIDSKHLSGVIRASGDVLHALVSLRREDQESATHYATRAFELLQGRMPDQGHLYVQMRVAQIFRTQGAFDRALELTQLTVSQAIETSHFHSAGNALMQLAEISRATDRSELATLAVFAGSRIPGEVSTSLRREFRNLASEMQATDLNPCFDRWNELYARSDWTESALAAARA